MNIMYCVLFLCKYHVNIISGSLFFESAVAEHLRVLVVEAQGLRLALPLTCVAEVFRPLPTQPLAGAADFVLGLTQARGRSTVVVDLNRLLGLGDCPEVGRYVRLRVDDRSVILAVERAHALADLGVDALEALPPLLGEGARHFQGLASLDERLLVVLQGAKLLDEGAAAGHGQAG
jgi:purine-binding chemotaxis protein CheW